RVLLGSEGEVHWLARVGEAAYALGDDVAEHLRRARFDGVAATSQLLVLPVAAVGRVVLTQRRVRSEDLECELRDALVRLRPDELRDGALRPRHSGLHERRQ